MTITIKIDTGNAAFEEDPDVEIHRMLFEWLRKGMGNARLYDYNGNAVGRVTVTGK